MCLCVCVSVDQVIAEEGVGEDPWEGMVDDAVRDGEGGAAPDWVEQQAEGTKASDLV